MKPGFFLKTKYIGSQVVTSSRHVFNRLYKAATKRDYIQIYDISRETLISEDFPRGNFIRLGFLYFEKQFLGFKTFAAD